MSDFENATPRPWRKRKEKNATYEIIAKQGPITVCPAVAHGKDDADEDCKRGQSGHWTYSLMMHMALAAELRKREKDARKAA